MASAPTGPPSSCPSDQDLTGSLKSSSNAVSMSISKKVLKSVHGTLLGGGHNWIPSPSRLPWFLSLSFSPPPHYKQNFWEYKWKQSDPQGCLSEGKFWCGGSVGLRMAAVANKHNLSLCYLGDSWLAGPPQGYSSDLSPSTQASHPVGAGGAILMRVTPPTKTSCSKPL